MKKDHYIGVDISKKTFDVAIYVNSKASKGSFLHESFDNSEEGFRDMKRKVSMMLKRLTFGWQITASSLPIW